MAHAERNRGLFPATGRRHIVDLRKLRVACCTLINADQEQVCAFGQEIIQAEINLMPLRLGLRKTGLSIGEDVRRTGHELRCQEACRRELIVGQLQITVIQIVEFDIGQ